MQVSAGAGKIFHFISAVYFYSDPIWNCFFNFIPTKDHSLSFLSSWRGYKRSYFFFLKAQPWEDAFPPALHIESARQIGQHKTEPLVHYPLTLIWNECEIICLFGLALLWSGSVWCFIYCHLHAKSSVNPLFVFKHLSWLLCVSLSPYWLLWAVCLAGCQWSWSGRQPAVGDDAWFQRCVTADSGSVLSVFSVACLSACLSEYLSVWETLLSLHLSAGIWITKNVISILYKCSIHFFNNE